MSLVLINFLTEKIYKMKKIILIIPLLLMSLWSMACPACEKQTPKILRGISHGAGPDGNVDYVIVAVSALIVLVTFYYSLKWILKPGEKAPNHIKRTILNFD